MSPYLFLLIILVKTCAGAPQLAASSTTEYQASPQKKSDILRQLLNQETLIRMSLTKDVQSLLKYQRRAEGESQAREKNINDLKLEVDGLTSETESLKQMDTNLTNKFIALLRDEQEEEKLDQARDNKIKNLEDKIEELTKKMAVLTQKNSNLTRGVATINVENLLSQIAGVQNEISAYPDIVVQAACAASYLGGFVSAIRRTCSNEASSCDVVCRDATSQMKAKMGNQGRKQATCVQSFHFYGSDQNLVPGVPLKVNRIMYRYDSNGCSKQFCGPNFCCCTL
ncbi:uncharacterized protein LOC133183654 [Saccostrea echinata]|uniref:uncharacterized protein LOC133183654 n=1 Tax=Saccostrea echinata TaxID=191078 RepID=UPI002A812B1C|nr:uncharacterized protein LOC133183654 [Saccostrea echinata]